MLTSSGFFTMNSRYILNIPLKWLAISRKCWTSSVTTSSLTLNPFLQRSVVSLSFHGTGVGSSYKKYRFSFSYPRWNRTIRNKVEIYIYVGVAEKMPGWIWNAFLSLSSGCLIDWGIREKCCLTSSCSCSFTAWILLPQFFISNVLYFTWW